MIVKSSLKTYTEQFSFANLNADTTNSSVLLFFIYNDFGQINQLSNFKTL